MTLSASPQLVKTKVPQRQLMIAADLWQSELVGLWADREDIEDSVVFAHRLRQQAQYRAFSSEQIKEAEAD